jgi:hypothetical protein
MVIMDASLDNNNVLGNLVLGGRSRSDTLTGVFYPISHGYAKKTNIPVGGSQNTGSFLASFGASNGRLKYATFFGGGDHFYLDGLTWDNAKQEIVFNGYVHGDFSIIDTTGATPGRDTISLRRASGRYFQDSNPDWEAAFIGSFNLSRDLVWSTLVGGNALDVINVVVPDKSGGLYALGNTLSSSSTANTVSASPLTAPVGATLPFVNPGKGAFFQINSTTRTGFVLHFNANRAIDWSTLYGGGTDNEFLGIAVNSANDLYIAGMTVNADTIQSSIADNGPSTHRIPAYDAVGTGYKQDYGSRSGSGHNQGIDAVIARFDASHRLRWSTLFGRAGTERTPIRLAIDHANHVYMAGNNLIDTNNGATAQGIPIYTVPGRYQQDSNASARSLLTPSSINSNLESSDGWIVQFNTANVPVWSTHFGGTLSGAHPITTGNGIDAREIISSIDAVTTNGLVSLYMAGVTKNPKMPVNYTGTSSRRVPYLGKSWDDPTHGGNWDCFFGMFNNARATSVPGVTPTQRGSSIIVAPNPSHDRFTVTFNNESGASRVPMVVTNAFGQIMLSGEINVVYGKNQFVLDLAHMAAGIYFVQIASQDKSEAARMVKY